MNTRAFWKEQKIPACILSLLIVTLYLPFFQESQRALHVENFSGESIGSPISLRIDMGLEIENKLIPKQIIIIAGSGSTLRADRQSERKNP